MRAISASILVTLSCAGVLALSGCWSSSPAASDAGAVPPPPPPPGNGAPTVAVGPSPSATAAAPASLLPAVAAALGAGEAAWQQAVATGGDDPTLSPQAPAAVKALSAALQAAYGTAGQKSVETQVLPRLESAARRFFFSSSMVKDAGGLFTTHEILAGQNLNEIGKPMGMGPGLVNLMRGAKPEDSLYRVGERLKLINIKETGYHMVVDKSDFTMDLYIGGIFAKRFPIGHGADETFTPTGTTVITAREPKPQWTHPRTNQVFPYGHPENILGDAWMAFDPQIGKRGLGIHGYTGADGKAVGVKASNGCVRMRNEDVTLLYHMLVPVGRAPMTVRIIE